MLRYILRRLLYAIPILLGVGVFTFIIFYATVTPRQMARRNLSAKNPSEKQIHEWIVQHGYDKPKIQQFKDHFTELLLMRFGKSDATGEDIWQRIRAGASASSMIASMILIGSLLVSITIAIIVAYYRGTYIDTGTTFLSVLFMSISFIVYIVAFQYLFGKVLKYFPLAGYRGGLDAWKFVQLPVMISIVSGLGSGVRLYRTFLLDEINQDYVRTARAKGVSEQAILFRHVLKNAAIPIITTVVLNIPFVILGNLLVENFFGIPGLGGMTIEAITNQDFAVIRAMVYLGTILYIIGTLLTDICYALADPRVRFE